MDTRALELICIETLDKAQRAYRRVKADPECPELREIYLMALDDYGAACRMLNGPEGEECGCRGCQGSSVNGMVDF